VLAGCLHLHHGGGRRELELPTCQTQAECVKRPVLNLSGQALEQEDYEHFLYMFDQYKNRLGQEQDGAMLLRECLGTDVSKILYSNFGADLSWFSKADIKNNIAKCEGHRTPQAQAGTSPVRLHIPGNIESKSKAMLSKD
jgi:hypothetical protein